MSYPISHIEGIDGDAAKSLKAAGIRSTERLLDRVFAGRLSALVLNYLKVEASKIEGGEERNETQ